MPYIGNQPGTGTRNRFIYTATASQTTFSGADDNGKTLKYADSDFVDVFLNGVCLVPVTDYTSTSKTSVVLTQAASLNDTLEVIAYDIATIADTVSKADGGSFDGNVGFGTAPERQVHIAGNPSILLMEDTGGGTNDKKAQVQVDSGVFEVNSRNDDNSSLKDNILVAELDTGNIGLGINTPSSMLHLFDGGTDTGITLQSKVQANATSSIKFMSRKADNTNINCDIVNVAGALRFDTNGTDRARFDADGNFGIATSTNVSLTNSEEGFWYQRNDWMAVSRDSGPVAYFNRLTDDGDIVIFRRAGTSVGTVGVSGTDNLYISGLASSHGGLTFATRSALPSLQGVVNDDGTDLGQNGNVFRDIYAGNTTIQTSDQREKQQIASLTDAEIAAAKSLSKLFKTFKWNSAVETKGDKARTHTGHIAQQVETAMSDAGLDVGNYAFFVSGTWWETQTEVPAVEADEENGIEAQDAYTRTDTYQTKEEAPNGATERNRKSLRYPELLAFIGAATEQRLTSIEARLTALEAE